MRLKKPTAMIRGHLINHPKKNGMAQDIFIGVDGGGTKTKAQAELPDGTLLGTGRGGPANIRTSIDTAWNSVLSAIQQALSTSGISLNDPAYCFHAGLGLAGTEIPSAKTEFLSRPHPFASVLLESDAHAACLGVHGGKDGAIVIIGTGVIGYSITHNEVFRVSGWGFPHDDLGGGAWLGLQATSLTLQWQDGRCEKSPLLEAVFQYFNHRLDTLVVWANAAKPGDFGKLAPLVTEHAQTQDEHALCITQKAQQHIEHTIETLLKKTNQSLNFSLLGGLANFFETRLRADFKSKIVPRLFDAPKGAILMISQQRSH